MASLPRLENGALFANDFRVLEPLSQGGMGAVYRVLQLSTQATRALKLMHPQLTADPRLRQRFEQEARVAARIESDHVVKVLAAGIDAATETPWLVMELLEGLDLAAHVERHGAVPTADVAVIFEQLGHAIAAAHAADIVHRDLKAENIFLARSRIVGIPWIVKVLDFGIAKVASEVRATDTAAIGSPIWMAPEQSTRGASITPQTDVWALGLIAFYLLCGRYFWNAARDEAASTLVLMREILLEPIPAASARAQELGCLALLPTGFDAVFARSVCREPSQRFRDASEMMTALRPVLAAPLMTQIEGFTSPTQALALSAESPLHTLPAAPPSIAVARTVLDPRTPQALTPQALVQTPAASTPVPAAPGRARTSHSRRTLGFAAGVVALAGLVWFVGSRSRAAALHGVGADSATANGAASSSAQPPATNAVPSGTEAPSAESPPSAAALAPPIQPHAAELSKTKPLEPSSPHTPQVTPPNSPPGPAPSPRHPADPRATPPPNFELEPSPLEPSPLEPPTPGASSFDHKAANATLAAAEARARNCHDGPGGDGNARVIVRFGNSGDPSSVRVEGPGLARGATARCIAAEFRACHVPAFEGLPVVLRRKVVVSQ